MKRHKILLALCAALSLVLGAPPKSKSKKKKAATKGAAAVALVRCVVTDPLEDEWGNKISNRVYASQDDAELLLHRRAWAERLRDVVAWNNRLSPMKQHISSLVCSSDFSKTFKGFRQRMYVYNYNAQVIRFVTGRFVSLGAACDRRLTFTEDCWDVKEVFSQLAACLGNMEHDCRLYDEKGEDSGIYKHYYDEMKLLLGLANTLVGVVSQILDDTAKAAATGDDSARRSAPGDCEPVDEGGAFAQVGEAHSPLGVLDAAEDEIVFDVAWHAIPVPDQQLVGCSRIVDLKPVPEVVEDPVCGALRERYEQMLPESIASCAVGMPILNPGKAEDLLGGSLMDELDKED